MAVMNGIYKKQAEEIKAINDFRSRRQSRLDNMDGGPGSGNWGHAGRPGKKGGSAGGGGVQNRVGDKESGFSAKSKKAEWHPNVSEKNKYEDKRLSPKAKRVFAAGDGEGENRQIAGREFFVQQGSGNLHNSKKGVIEDSGCKCFKSPEGIDFVVEDGVADEYASAVIESFYGLPDYIRYQCPENVIINKGHIAIGEEAYAAANANGGYLQIYASANPKDSIRGLEFKHTITHEIVHNIDHWYVEDYEPISREAEWGYEDAALDDGIWVSKYGKATYAQTGSMAEDFADGFATYITGFTEDRSINGTNTISKEDFEDWYPERARVYKEVIDTFLM